MLQILQGFLFLVADLRGYHGGGGEEEGSHYSSHVLGIMTASTDSEIGKQTVQKEVNKRTEKVGKQTVQKSK